MNKKQNARHIASQCCCQKLIDVMLVERWCDAFPRRAFVFERLLAALVSKASERRRSRRQVVFSNEEYPEETVNMVGRVQTSQAALKFDSSNYEQGQGSVGVYRYTRSRTNQVAPVDYNKVNA